MGKVAHERICTECGKVDYSCECVTKFVIGQPFYMDKGPGKLYKCHVVTVVDTVMVVYKWYGRRKQWWHYQIDSAYMLAWRVRFDAEKQEK